MPEKTLEEKIVEAEAAAYRAVKDKGDADNALAKAIQRVQALEAQKAKQEKPKGNV